MDNYNQPRFSGHGKWICTCGAVIAQCRCIQGHGKPQLVANGCKDCQTALKQIAKNPDLCKDCTPSLVAMRADEV